MKNIYRFMIGMLLISSSSLSVASGETMLADLDCAQLYHLATTLEPQTRRQKSIIFNEKSRLIAAVIGTVENAGVALFGVDLAWSYYEDWRRLGKSRQLELTRRQMAGKFCFEKS